MTVLNGALPGFDISGGMPLAVLRGSFDAALFSSFGSLLFWAGVLTRARARMPAEAERALDNRLLLLVRVSLVAALATGAAWLLFEAGLMAEADGPAQALGAIPTVLASTAFGHLLAAQGIGLALAILLLRRGTRPGQRNLALAASAGVLLLQAGHGHAMSMYGGVSLLLASEAVHLLAGGAWLGGLLPLLLAARLAPPRAAATAARSFSVLGKWCVGLVAATAACQAWTLIGSVPGLLGTAYGWIACIKLLVFGVLLGFAWVNRYRFAPALLGAQPDRAARRLSVSIAVQTGVGVLVLLAAGMLSSLPPSMHLQAIWPFSQRFSLAAIREDAGFHREVVLALLALGGAVVLAASALLLRGWRRLAVLVAAVAIAVLALPHLDLLLAEASPTSFYHSPTGFAVASIDDGAAVYPDRCAACHGAEGRGDGPLAATLPVPPADLTAGHLWMHDDGELFGWLTHGIEAPQGGLAMPGFGAVLSEDRRWALIDFIRARNAGLARRATGAWPAPLRPPALQATCAGSRLLTLDQLRGRIVRVAFGKAADLPDRDVVTVRVTSDPSARADARTCVADDQAIRSAYALIAGLNQGALGNEQFLIDAEGWLRTVVGPEPAASGRGLAVEGALNDLRRHPVPPAPMDHAHMTM